MSETRLHATPRVVDAACDAMRAGKTHYEQTVGLHDLRAAYAEKARTRNGLAAATEHVITTPGSTQALFASMSLMVGPGTRCCSPRSTGRTTCSRRSCWARDLASIRSARGTSRTSTATRRAVTDRTRGILINSPSNPTGAVFHERTLRALYEIARERISGS
jgi:aspartate/methionine/tyrosine aminotransferase